MLVTTGRGYHFLATATIFNRTVTGHLNGQPVEVSYSVNGKFSVPKPTACSVLTLIWECWRLQHGAAVWRDGHRRATADY